MEKSTLGNRVIFDALAQSLPLIFPCRRIPELTGGLLPVGAIANMGADGPPFRRIGRHAVYTRKSFLIWFTAYLGIAE